MYRHSVRPKRYELHNNLRVSSFAAANHISIIIIICSITQSIISNDNIVLSHFFFRLFGCRKFRFIIITGINYKYTLCGVVGPCIQTRDRSKWDEQKKLSVTREWERERNVVTNGCRIDPMADPMDVWLVYCARPCMCMVMTGAPPADTKSTWKIKWNKNCNARSCMMLIGRSWAIVGCRRFANYLLYFAHTLIS